MKYEWDEDKASLNFSKHGVSFDEAQSLFDDPFFIVFYDPDHSEEEQRYIIVGRSSKERLLMVSYTERGDIVRIISSRELTAKERKAYEEG